ncbi:MAG: DUF1493 family protein [Pseudomonadota bacterium]
MAADRAGAPVEEEIVAFFEKQTGSTVRGGARDDLLIQYGLDGDDAYDFIEAYGRRFDVDLSGYWATFHHRSEGTLLRWFPRFGDASWRVRRIPISAAMLTRFASEGVWRIDYPVTEGQSAERVARWEMAIRNLLFFCVFSAFVIAAASLLLSVDHTHSCSTDRAELASC